MRLKQSDDDINAPLPKIIALTEHFVGLAHAGSCPNIYLEGPTADCFNLVHNLLIA
ncbi:hypothetical protein D3C81_2233660 [compost metagenome]